MTRQFGPERYGVDINQPGASAFPRFSTSAKSPYLLGLVEDVITNEEHPLYDPLEGRNVGFIIVRFLPEERDVPIERLSSALPMDVNIRQYPLKNEVVIVLRPYGGQSFYFRPLNTTNKPTENSWPNLTLEFSNGRASDVSSVDERRLAQRGGNVDPNRKTNTLFDGRFRVNESVRPVRPAEGDLIFEGRFGNIIRFGSSLFSNPTARELQPNLLITVGQATPTETSTSSDSKTALTYEDINNDKNSIWIVTDEEVPFVATTARSKATRKAHLFSSEKPTAKYTGAQIFVSSDRVILNTKKNEISLFSATEINLSALKSVTVDTERSVLMSANKDIRMKALGDVVISGRNISLFSTEDLSYKTDGNYSIVGRKIFIGKHGDTTQPMVLGSTLAQWLNAVLTTIVTPGSFISSVGPVILRPDRLANLVALRAQLGTPTSPQQAIFNSRDNFTAETNT